MGEKLRKMKKLHKISLWVLVLILVASTVWGVTAKYTQQREQEVVVQAKMFYFTSDLLDGRIEPYKLNAGTSEVTVALRNHLDDHRISEENIQFTVTVQDITDPENLGAITQVGETYELAGGVANSIPVEIPGLQDGHKYEIVATSMAEGPAGYEKSLKAPFEVQRKARGFFANVEDKPNSSYVILTVWSQNCAGKVSVTFPDNLIPDTTDPKMSSITNYAEGKYSGATVSEIDLQEYSSLSFRFFKDNTETYSLGQFTVTLTDADGNTSNATPGTP